ncbi:B12-binding domain-containing radical SAM protein [Sporomusa sp.]|uniref:B12-binding domain-containing radical SAM protein n=1 Tax=Sporomusa sp. TaxID=2078658 RepID=UPI002CFCD695|nr:B12-binding domain-containing radical SAM protein [Sporomusa sp.]HWR43422.1 B12-binding domain-containing radical SAM protein [Sporomusa sp.]
MRNIDVLLVNSLAPRQRIASDAALENGLAIIRTHLEERGFIVYVADEQRVSGPEKGVPRWYLKMLRLLSVLQLKAFGGGMKIVAYILLLLAWPLHALSLYYRRSYLEKLIENLAALVSAEHIPLVGIKVWNGEAYKWSVALARKIRAVNPEAVVIAGGPQVKVYGSEIFAQEAFDLAIMGPGEEILAVLLQKRKAVLDKESFLEVVRQEISSSLLIRTGHYSSENQYMPAVFTIPRYRPADMDDKILFHTLIDGVGCTWSKCSFCSHTRQNSCYIPRPVEQIKDEILAMSQQGIAFFRFSSSETPPEHGQAIAQMLLENNFDINYSMFVRAGKASTKTYNAYRLMLNSGLKAVFMGGETGHDAINAKVMNKGVSQQEIVETIECIRLAAAETGKTCRVGLAMIYPCPVLDGITLSEVFQENLRLVARTRPDTVIINPPGVFPGTVWFEQAEKLGFKFSEDFVARMMQYEYSMYKPVEFWSKIEFSLNGMDVRSLLQETGKLARAIEAMGIPIGISDEYLMMLEALGEKSAIGLLKFKHDSLLDVLSGSTGYIGQTVAKINDRSKELALANCNQLKIKE